MAKHTQSFVPKTKEEMEDMELWDILQYYKQCILLNEKKGADLKDHIWIIELAIRDMWHHH